MAEPTVISDTPRVQVSEGTRKWNLFLMSMSVVLITLDSTIANVALPHIQGAMSTTQDQLAWVLTSYILANAIFMPLTGFLCDRYGRREVLIPSVIAFTLTSAMCGLAQNLEELVLFRFLQGVAGAFIVPAGQALMLDIHTRAQYTKALTLWGIGTIIGPILGPTLGGYLTEFYSWRWVFLINLPIGVLVAVGMYLVVPKTPLNYGRSMDFLGFFLLSLGIAALQLMFDRGESQGWFASWEIIIFATMAAVFSAMFLLHIGSRRSPYISLDCFKDRNFTIGTVFVFVNVTILFASMALLPGYLQNLMHFPVFVAGLLMAPRGVGSLLGLLVFNRFGTRFDPRVFIALGFGSLILALAMMTNFSLYTSLEYIVIAGVIQGFAMSLVFLPTNIILFSTLSPHLQADGAAISGLIRSLGGSLGISFLFTLLARNTQSYHAQLVEHITPFHTWLDYPAAWQWTTQQGALLLNGEITRQAAMQAYVVDFAIMQWLAMAAMLMLVFVRFSKAPSGAASAAKN